MEVTIDKQVPVLRFPEFEGEWESKRIGDYTFSSAFGPRFSSDLYSPTGNVVTLRTTDMDMDGKIDYRKAPRAQIDIEQLKEHILAKDDLVISRSGTIGITGIFEGYELPVIPGAFLIRFRLNQKELQTKFVQVLFNSEKGRNKIESLSAGGVQKNLTGTSILNLYIKVPSLPEQQKIADFLTAIDDKIQQLTRKKSLLEQYKKGVMQQIFSQSIRFKDDNGNDYPDWEEKKLGEVSIKKSSNISANKIQDNYGDYIIYGASGILKKVDFYKEENDYISIIKDGAGVGRLLYCAGKSSVLGTMEIIKPHVGINTYFLYCLLNNVDFVKYVTGSTIPHIYFKDYSNEICGVPNLAEQQKIASFLSSLDTKIESVEKQIKTNQAFKKGLLQQLFV